MDLQQLRYANDDTRTLSTLKAFQKAGVRYDLQLHVHQAINLNTRKYTKFQVMLPKQPDENFSVILKFPSETTIDLVDQFKKLCEQIVSNIRIGVDPETDWTQEEYSDNAKFGAIYKAQVLQNYRVVEVEDDTITVPLNIASSPYAFFNALLSMDASKANEIHSGNFYTLYRNGVFYDQILELNLSSIINNVGISLPSISEYCLSRFFVNNLEVSCDWSEYTLQSSKFKIHVFGKDNYKDYELLARVVNNGVFEFHQGDENLIVHAFDYVHDMDITEYFANQISIMQTILANSENLQ
jgi:hypothetical protein